MSIGSWQYLRALLSQGLAWVAYRAVQVGLATAVILALLTAFCGPAVAHDALLGGNAFKAAPVFKSPPHMTAPKMRPTCAAYGAIKKTLADKYKEHPDASGFNADQGVVVEIMSSAEGTFTILLKLADGTACVVSSGDGWRREPRTDGPAS